MTFAGSSIDHYDDGGFAVLLDVELARDGQKERRIFSANAMPEEETLLGHCVVLVEPSESKLVLRAGPAR